MVSGNWEKNSSKYLKQDSKMIGLANNDWKLFNITLWKDAMAQWFSNLICKNRYCSMFDFTYGLFH